MLKRPSDHRLTLEERVAVVIAIAVAVGVHVAVFFVGGGIGRLVREETRRERLMVIRRVRDVTPPPEVATRVPDARRVQVPLDQPVDQPGGAPPKPEQKVSEHGTLPKPPKSEITPKMEEDLQSSEPPGQAAAPTEQKPPSDAGVNSVSVVTDLPTASFSISGPAEYSGTGTFWIRRGAPAGTYRIAFSTVEGFGTPPPQTRELPEKGQIVFVGKYRRSTEVVVESNEPEAQFTIYRPDGRALDMSRPGRAVFDDLPLGNYTAVFKDLPGRITPAPISRTLSPGGRLVFSAEYKHAPGRSVASADPVRGSYRGGTPGARDGGGEGSGEGGGSGSGRGGTGRGGGREAGLDRRVQLIVSSTPPTSVEEWHTPIAYPEIVISKSNFQQGWCQVYLVVKVGSDGEIRNIVVERPRFEEREQYEALIRAVEESVRGWEYDTVSAEVHVDVRFYVE